MYQPLRIQLVIQLWLFGEILLGVGWRAEPLIVYLILQQQNNFFLFSFFLAFPKGACVIS